MKSVNYFGYQVFENGDVYSKYKNIGLLKK